MSLMRIIAIALLIIGAVVLVLGVYDLVTFNSSRGGKIANRVGKKAGSRPEAVRNAIIKIAIGAGCAVGGMIIYKKR